MWSPILKMLPACILGLSVLGAAMPSVPRDWIYPVHPTDADLVAKGQCYSYLEDQEYNITASLLPCIEKCPGTETVEVCNIPALAHKHIFCVCKSPFAYVLPNPLLNS